MATHCARDAETRFESDIFNLRRVDLPVERRMTCEGQWFDPIHFDFVKKVTLTANDFGKILSGKRLKRFESTL